MVDTLPEKPFWRTVLASTPVTAVIDSLIDDYQHTPKSPKPGPAYAYSRPALAHRQGERHKSHGYLWKTAAVLGVAALGSCLAVKLLSTPKEPVHMHEPDYLNPSYPPAPPVVSAPQTVSSYKMGAEMKSKYQDALSIKTRKLEDEANALRSAFNGNCYGPFKKMRHSQETRLERYCRNNLDRQIRIRQQVDNLRFKR